LEKEIEEGFMESVAFGSGSLWKDPRSTIYHGHPSVTSYDITFPFFEKSHLAVTVTRKSDGMKTALVLDSGFSVTREDENHPYKVVTEDPWDSGHTITITRKMPLTQNREYVEGQRIPMQALERSFDWIVMQVQWLLEYFTGLVNDRPTHAEMTAAIAEAKLHPDSEIGRFTPLELTAPPADGSPGERQTLYASFPGTVGVGGNIMVYLRYPGLPDLGPYLVPVQAGDGGSLIRSKIYNELSSRTAVTALANIGAGGTGTLIIERKIEADYSSGFGLLVSLGPVTGISYWSELQIGGTAASPGTSAGIGQLAIVTMPGSGNKYTFIAQGIAPMRWAGVTAGLIHDAELPGWKILRFSGSGTERTTEHAAIF
jgi:hypothetical protein